MTNWVPRSLALGPLLWLAVAPAAFAQANGVAPEAPETDTTVSEVVVTAAQSGAVVGGVVPELQLDPADIHLPANRDTGEPERPADAVRDAFPPGTSATLQMIERTYCKAGATYLAGSGTDAFGTMPGISLHAELALLVQSGLTPRQALAAATANVGTIFGWPVGKIEPGAAADLLVLDADPTLDVANLARIRHVVLAGELLDRAALLRRP